jgi:predicted alpha/beta hydrolase family esterase
MASLLTSTVVILPGLGNSGPNHWQSLWEKSNPDFSRIKHDDWEHPICSTWVSKLEETLSVKGPNTVLVAHSLACLLVAHWSAVTRQNVRGALLVAPPDPDSSAFPTHLSTFARFPKKTFTFPCIVVGSENDAYGSISFAKDCALSWGGELVNAGNAGHINADSGYGVWETGEQLLKKLRT